MKTRIIDTQLIPAVRKPVDQAWNVFANHLISAFGDITQQNGFSSEDTDLVYCPHRLRELDEKLLDSLIYNVPPAFVDSVLLQGTEAEGTALQYFDDARVHWKAAKDSPFLLLGYVGTGKTTFLDYYFWHHLPRTSEKIKGLIVNFKTAPDDNRDFLMYMIEQVDCALSDIDPNLGKIDRQLMEKLFASEIAVIRSTIQTDIIREGEIDRLFAVKLRGKVERDAGIYADLVGRKIATLREKGYQIWLVLDNIDQHFHCLHHQAFVNAVSYAFNWKCPLIIAMRYVTLHTPDARQTYDSFQPRRLRLSFPHVGELIGRRIKYFKLLADQVLEKLSCSPELGPVVKLEKPRS